MLSRIPHAAAPRAIVLAGRLAIVAVGAVWIAQGDCLSASVALVALALTELTGRFLRDARLRVTTDIVMAVLLAAHIVLGMYLGLYETSRVYDKVMHVLGSGAIAVIQIVAVQAYCQRHRLELPVGLLVTLVFTGSLSTGTLWELFEFAIDQTGLFVAQRGLTDTMLDLLADGLGAMVILLMFTATSRYSLTGEKTC